MILITGSAGKTGRSIVQALVERDTAVRALVYRVDQVSIVESLGAQEVLVGDMRSPEVIQRGLLGVQAVYHICPNMSPDELSIGKTLIAAAQAESVEHFVYHSVLKPQIKAMPHHWNKLLVEERLIQSDLPYTILQPAAYMQNLLAHWETIVNHGFFPVPYPEDTPLSLVDLMDVAQVAAIVLTERSHQFATYELVGIEGWTQNEVAAALCKGLQREVRVEHLTLEQWRKGALNAGLDSYQVDSLVKMFAYYAEHGFEGNTRVLTWLLGHPPTSLQDFIQRSLQESRKKQESPVM